MSLYPVLLTVRIWVGQPGSSPSARQSSLITTATLFGRLRIFAHEGPIAHPGTLGQRTDGEVAGQVLAHPCVQPRECVVGDKTFGAGFDCFAEDATCNLGVADWHCRETIKNNLRAFIDSGFTALHVVDDCLDGEALKVFRGTVTMTPDDSAHPVVQPTMTHFFYMDEADDTKVRRWCGAVGPVAF